MADRTYEQNLEDEAEARKELTKSYQNEIDTLESLVELDKQTDFDLSAYQKIFKDNQHWMKEMDSLLYYAAWNNYYAATYTELSVRKFQTEFLGFSLSNLSKEIIDGIEDPVEELEARVKVSVIINELLERKVQEMKEKLSKSKKLRRLEISWLPEF
jgi:hypothetical protein